MKKRGWILPFAVLFLFTGCGEEEINMTEDEFPYGSTLEMNYVDYNAPLQYDRRFITAEMATVIGNYYHSLEVADTDLYVSVQPEDYLNYQLKDVYSNEYTAEDIVKTSHDAMVEYVGSDYVISLVDITNMTEEVATTDIPVVLDMLDSISEEKDGSHISAEIEKICQITLDLYVDTAEKGTKGYTSMNPVTDEILYLYEQNGTWYIVA